MSETTEQSLSALLHETRRFEPPADFAAKANAQPGIYEAAASDPVGFWEEQARHLTWGEGWRKALEWDVPFAKWFVGGKLNVSYNCVDRHVEAGLGDRVAFYWEGEPGDTRTITYRDLMQLVCRAANALLELGVRRDTKVAIYMPMLPRQWLPCLPAPGSALPIRSCSGGFRRTPFGTGSSTATPGWS
jgi:acetyl-CoA synthetase